MSGSDPVGNIFDDIDKNRDGKIDRNELRNWVSNNDGSASTAHDSYGHTHDSRDKSAGRYDRYRYQETITGSSTATGDNVVNTASSEETKRYLERAGINVFIDSNPKIIRRQTTERPLTFEQRVFIRCLQPPALPPPEPLIIKEVRAEQPPPPPPLVIREQMSLATSPPPIILRERPPTPPPRPKGGTTIRHLPPLPVPPRSLIIERMPPPPEKPRDIVIERWIPYGPLAEPRTIVQPAPPPIQYPAPTHTIIEYDGIQSNIVRKFERAGVTQEDPDTYVSRHGSSLLDSNSLIQQARKLGVTEDITCPVRLATANVVVHEKNGDFDRSSSAGYSYERVQRASGGDVTSNTYSSGASHCVEDTNVTIHPRDSRSGFLLSESSRTVTHLKRDSEMI